jgi:hypothetical protein
MLSLPVGGIRRLAFPAHAKSDEIRQESGEGKHDLKPRWHLFLRRFWHRSHDNLLEADALAGARDIGRQLSFHAVPDELYQLAVAIDDSLLDNTHHEHFGVGFSVGAFIFKRFDEEGC